MAISQQEFKRRYAAIREQMEKENLDCILIVGLPDDFNRGNIRYVTGFGRGGNCVFPVESPPIFPIIPMQATSPKLPKLMAAYELIELRSTVDIEGQVISEIETLDRGNKIGVVGMKCMSISLHKAVMEKYGDRLFDATEIFELLRTVKTLEEIEKTRVAAGIADEVYKRLREMIKPGIGEYEIYAEVKRITYSMGCEYSFDLIDAANASMNMSFYPTGDTLEDRGTLFMEISPAYDGYYSQLPVTLPVGEYRPPLDKMVNAWNKADVAVREILKPGVKASELNDILVSTIEANGFKSPYRPGHSVGLEILDFWSIEASNERVIKPGMILAIHPSVLIEMGGDGCGMGYTYLITDTGYERLSKIDLFEDLMG